MKISFVLKDSIYDCKIQITDMQGSRYYLIPAINNDDESEQYITADIYGNEFDLALIPIMPDISTMLNEFETNDWKDRLAKNTSKLLFSSLKKMILRVGCNYHVSGAEDGARLDITLQTYVFGTFDRFDLLELIPMMYMFFEVSDFNERFKLTNAFETNRKDVLTAAKAFALTDVLGNGFFLTLFTYPIQVGRIRYITKNKTILKKLSKFNNLNDFERRKFLEKQEKFIDS